MKDAIKRVIENLAGEINDFCVYFQKPFTVGEWVMATDCYAVIRAESYGDDGGYSPLQKKIDVNSKFPPKTCECLMDIDNLRERLKKEGYAEWSDRFSECEECEGDGNVCYTYTDSIGDVYEMSGMCPICDGDGLVERDGVVKIADAIVKPKYLLLLCELAEETGGSVWLLNRGGNGANCIYFKICDDMEMIIMPVRPSVAKREELLFEFKID